MNIFDIIVLGWTYVLQIVVHVPRERILHREFPPAFVQVPSPLRNGNPNDDGLAGARVSILAGLRPNSPLIRARDARTCSTRIIRRGDCPPTIFQQLSSNDKNIVA